MRPSFEDIKDYKFDVVWVCGIKALYANFRLPNVEGLASYDLRGCDGKHRCTVDRYVVIKYVGSIYTREPLDFEYPDYIALDEDSSLIFSGDQMTIDEFLKQE